MIHIPYSLCEAVSDLTAHFMTQQHLPSNSRDVVQLCVDWAAEFETRHSGTDWAEVEYHETIDAFFSEKYRAWIETIPARSLRSARVGGRAMTRTNQRSFRIHIHNPK